MGERGLGCPLRTPLHPYSVIAFLDTDLDLGQALQLPQADHIRLARRATLLHWLRLNHQCFALKQRIDDAVGKRSWHSHRAEHHGAGHSGGRRRW